ncbi:MAG: tRNA (guanosine(37)-N1)-methyltransferase TrmD [Candidatus Omnitrophota bacterium]|nr:MAG: tRNA (guanosine(37)-N1)-methyltransferase TrmD [Candidatus Omnitrophota bacterium]
MKIDVITIFPKMFSPVLNESIIKRAQAKGLLKIKIHNLRDYSKDKHRKIDDRPFGAGPGMVFQPEPIFRAVESIVHSSSFIVHRKKRIRKTKSKTKIILLSPQGKKLNHKLTKKLSRYKHLILICGHYEGVDERVRQKLVTDEVSIGDYVLTCGELPAMVLIDAVTRLIPKVLGKLESTHFESFSQDLLEYPQYTRPSVFRGMKVPEVLLSGNHKLIEKWRRDKALEITRKNRPDLLK